MTREMKVCLGSILTSKGSYNSIGNWISRSHYCSLDSGLFLSGGSDMGEPQDG
jgi:hypothetical protein